MYTVHAGNIPFLQLMTLGNQTPQNDDVILLLHKMVSSFPIAAVLQAAALTAGKCQMISLLEQLQRINLPFFNFKNCKYHFRYKGNEII